MGHYKRNELTQKDREILHRHKCISCRQEKASALFQGRYYCQDCFNKKAYARHSFNEMVKRERRNTMERGK